MNSIRNFLITTILAVIVLSIFVSSIHGYRDSMAAAENLFDSKLADVAQILSEASYSNRTNFNNETNLALPLTTTTSLVYEVWNEQQELLYRSHQLSQNFTDNRQFNNSLDYENFNAIRWRTLMQYYPIPKKWVWIAENNDIRFTLADSVLLESIIPSLLIIPLVGLIILLIVYKGLKPIVNLTAEIANKKANDLTLINLTEIPIELMNLTDSVNQLFIRLENSFKREKRLASDAAHELRTPIAVLILQIENLIADQPQNPAINELKLTAKRLSHLVEQILTLNKTTPELFVHKMQPIEIAPILRQVTASNFDLLESKHQTIEMDISESNIDSDSFAFETLFNNLLINAIKYTQAKGKIKIKLYQTDKQVILEVHDNGPGIPEQYRQRVLERFYRLDSDRSQSNIIGCGLGFSIVEHIVQLHQAKLLLLDSEFKQGLAVKVIFNKTEVLG